MGNQYTPYLIYDPNLRNEDNAIQIEAYEDSSFILLSNGELITFGWNLGYIGHKIDEPVVSGLKKVKVSWFISWFSVQDNKLICFLANKVDVNQIDDDSEISIAELNDKPEELKFEKFSPLHKPWQWRPSRDLDS